MSRIRASRSKPSVYAVCPVCTRLRGPQLWLVLTHHIAHCHPYLMAKYPTDPPARDVTYRCACGWEGFLDGMISHLRHVSRRRGGLAGHFGAAHKKQLHAILDGVAEVGR